MLTYACLDVLICGRELIMFCTSCGKHHKTTDAGMVCHACAPGPYTKTTILYCHRCGERVTVSSREGVFCWGCAPLPTPAPLPLRPAAPRIRKVSQHSRARALWAVEQIR